MLRVDSKNTFRVAIAGGLGNQLFKFMNGIRLSELFELQMILDLSFFSEVFKNDRYATPRNFELLGFPEIKKYPTTSASNLFYEKNFLRVLRRMPSSVQNQFGFITENSTIDSSSRIKLVEGSFERIDFLPSDDLIRKLTIFSDEEDVWLRDYKLLARTSKTLAIHVRLTDFLKNPEIYSVITPQYYLDAISAYESKFGKTKIWLFSDDPKMAISWLGDRIIFDHIVDSSAALNSVDVLHLMSLSNGIICANSTFSWWAAYIGSLNDSTKFVTIPSKFNSLSNDSPKNFLCRSGWLCL